MTNPPRDICIDTGSFALRCVDDYVIDEGDDFRPYVDVRLDTVPLHEGDPDFSEKPELLRKASIWLAQAAAWLEEQQASCLEE